MDNTDLIQRFYFAGQPFRGAVVKLQNSFVEALNGHNYPALLNALLGESLAASLLMGIHLKHNARISIQARGDGVVSLLMAEAMMQQASNTKEPVHTLRAVAKTTVDAELLAAGIEATHPSYLDLLGKSQLAITIEPEDGQRYQGIVAADQDSLMLCLQSYFTHSEQLPTFFQLATTATTAAGILLQRMPSDEDDHFATSAREDHEALTEGASSALSTSDLLWEELIALASTLSDQELVELPIEQMLHRLFHEHSLELSPPDPISFKCSCSQQRTIDVLMKISRQEIDQILQQDGEIVMDCEFCSARYRFGAVDIAQWELNDKTIRH